jgi:hypothetical protein
VGLTTTHWRKSSYSGTGGGQCVEVGQSAGIAVRDSTDRDGTVLKFAAGIWQEFIRGVK